MPLFDKDSLKTCQICKFLSKYNSSYTSRFHMPGHKGRGNGNFPDFLQQAFPFDLTEISGADALYEASGIIGESEDTAASLYGATSTSFSAGGSTLSILTMITLSAQLCGKEILAVRNAHSAFANACALTGVQPHWILPPYDQQTGLCAVVTPENIAAAMTRHPTVTAVYLTSPDYYGRIADVERIAAIVHKKGGLLFVDNAHGAHLAFTPENNHPIQKGADFCCDSPHKTLPVLTGGSCLHSRLPYPKEGIKAAMALYGSTSPSYLILASLDACNRYLAEGAREDFTKLNQRVAEVEQKLAAQGVTLLLGKTDCTKITIDCYRSGYTDEEIAQLLRQNRVEPEFCGGGKVVLMPSPFTTEEDFSRVIATFSNFAQKPLIPYPHIQLKPETRLSIREAVFSPFERLDVENAEGRIAAENRITCPPGVPIVVAGEIIQKEQKKLLKNSGIFSLKVVK